MMTKAWMAVATLVQAGSLVACSDDGGGGGGGGASARSRRPMAAISRAATMAR